MMRIVSLMRLGDQEERLQEQFPELHFEFYKHPSCVPKESIEKMDILLSYHQEVNETFIKQATNLKWIMWYATGVNALPFETLKAQHIQVTNAKGVHAQQLAEFLFAFILDDYKEMKETFREQQSKIYNHKRTTPSVAGETILFLGTGVIPQRAAKIAQLFGMHTVGLNTSGHQVEGFNETYSIDEREKVLKKANVIVNLLPETGKTKYLLTRHDFECMNGQALFINLGRGTIVKESILIDVLKSNLIRKAYLDVYEQEPLKPESQLYNLNNVVMTSHITGNGDLNKKLATDIFINNLHHFLNKEPLNENVVDLNKGY